MMTMSTKTCKSKLFYLENFLDFSKINHLYELSDNDPPGKQCHNTHKN